MFFRIRSNRLVGLGVVLCVGLTLLAENVCAQSGTKAREAKANLQSSRTLMAESQPQGASPFYPAMDREVQFPVAIQGFCTVRLRDQQEWQEGSAANQQMFDGKLYWFAGQREREIFRSNPRRYAPALAGDCVVTFAEEAKRVDGRPEFGVLHKRRLYFFRGAAEQAQFQADPDQYADADLASDGNCLVSRIDQDREVPGLPETTVIVKGLRYQFAGWHQQRTFLRDSEHYGVERPAAEYAASGSSNHLAKVAQANPDPLSKIIPPMPKQKAPPISASIKNKAMAGYSPVSIRDKGVWAEGDPRYRFEFDGLTYLMVDDNELALFKKNTNVYIPALAGHCVVTEIDENRRVKGTIYHAAQHEGEGRLFLFAGPQQKERFNEDPERYLRADVAADGLCIVSLLDDREEIEGLPEFMEWHNGKRYFFASAEKQAKFLERTELYQE